MWVYFLRCADKSYYTGVTNDLERRIKEHQSGNHIGYTSERLPVELVYSQEIKNPLDAINAEKQIKNWSRAKKEALIHGDFELLHKLAECKNESKSKNRKKY